MDSSEFLVYHQKLTDKCRAISVNKSHDYCGKSRASNPFSNLELVEKMGICATEIGILTRLTDKISRIKSFLEQGVLLVEDEKWEDTIVDLINYSILLAGVIKSKQESFTDDSSVLELTDEVYERQMTFD